MFKQELPLLFPDEPDVGRVRDAMFDPFEYLVLRDRDGLLRKDFKRPLGKVSYHVPCHSRVQNVGQKTREVLRMGAGHRGQHGRALRGPRRHLGREGRVLRDVDEDRQAGLPPDGATAPDYIASDCPIAGRRIEQGIDALGERRGRKEHPLTLVRLAYGLD